MEKETIEEAAEKYAKQFDYAEDSSPYNDFIEGGKWRQEQDKKMYSHEEVLVKLYECLGHFAYQHNIVINGNEIDKWFEQFKKK
jgi:hypothetical protein